jgi:hypothetical protein
MDFNKLIDLIKGGLFEPDSTWATYAAKRAPWLDTAIAFTLPVIFASALLTLIFGYLFSSFSVLGSAGIGGFFASLISGVLSVALWAAIASFFARMFDGGANAANAAEAADAANTLASDDTNLNIEAAPSGRPDFAQAFAAISFAFIPGFVGSVLGTVPWIGGLLSLAGIVYGAVLMYRCFPVFLGVAEDDRTKHFVATLVGGVVAGAILFVLMGAIGLGGAAAGGLLSGKSMGDSIEESMSERIERSIAEAEGRSSNSDSDGESYNSSVDRSSNDDGGLFGIGRQTEYVEAATSDSFSPPQDGRLDEDQVTLLIRFLNTTKDMRDESSQRLQNISDKADNNDNPSLGDLFGGLRNVMDMGTAEMQVVKSGGGNWAEHEWVKKALFEARLHKDLNETISHNWALYSDHAEALDELL